MSRKPPATRQPGRRRGDAHRREIERLTRELLEYASGHPLHRFCIGTRRFIERVKPIVEQLDVVNPDEHASKGTPHRAGAQQKSTQLEGSTRTDP